MSTPRDSSPGGLSTADISEAASRDRQAPSNANRSQAEPVQCQPQDRVEMQRKAPLFAGSEAERFRHRWSDIQAGFVDEPRSAVENADELVAEVMQRLAQVFADERHSLEQQWDRGEQTNTEDLRQALQRYRSFFDRLLSM